MNICSYVAQNQSGNTSGFFTASPKGSRKLLAEEKEVSPSTRAHGHLERQLREKRLSDGTIATFPRVDGERSPYEPSHWYWFYSWQEKERGRWRTKRTYVPQHRVCFVRQLIADEKSVQAILMHLSPSAAGKGGAR